MRRICELSANIGSFRLGFSQASSQWDFVFSQQYEYDRKKQSSFICYQNHFDDNICINKEINEIDIKNIPKFNILVGELKYNKHSTNDYYSFKNIFSLIYSRKPSFIFFEAPKKILTQPTQQRGYIFGTLLNFLYNNGYIVEWRNLSPSYYGFSQRRERIYIFAVHYKTKYYQHYKFNFFNGSFEKSSFSSHLFKNQRALNYQQKTYQYYQQLEDDFFYKNSFFTNIFPIQDVKEVRHISLSILNHNKDMFTFSFGKTGFIDIDGNIFTTEVIPQYIYPKDIKSILLDEYPHEVIIDKNTLETIKKNKKYKSLEDNNYKAGNVIFPDDITMPSRTISEVEASLNKMSHVIYDSNKKIYRYLTPVECERLQELPDNWTTMLKNRERYFCIGRASHVGIIQKVANSLNQIIDNENN